MSEKMEKRLEDLDAAVRWQRLQGSKLIEVMRELEGEIAAQMEVVNHSLIKMVGVIEDMYKELAADKEEKNE